MSANHLEAKRRQLEKAKKSLNVLEEQAAGIPPSKRDVTLVRDLQDQREKVRRLQAEVSELEWAEQRDKGIVEFVNRAEELKRVCRDPSRPQFVLIDAPAGFGKTVFLLEAQRIFTQVSEESNRDQPITCVLVDFARLGYRKSEAENRIRLLRAMLEQTLAQGIEQDYDPGSLIDKLAGSLAKGKKKNAQLLFDSVDLLQAEGRDELKAWIWNTLIPSLLDRLEVPEVKLYAMFAGRYISKWWKGRRRYLLVTEYLSPFDEEIVLKAIQTRAEKRGIHLTRDTALNIAQEAVDVTGGHPGCIMQILEKELAARNFTIVMNPSKEGYLFSHSERVRMFEQYVEPALRRILRNIDQPTVEALSTLSVFRRFNLETLDILITGGHIEWDGSARDLLSSIVQTHLIDTPTWPDPMYTDKLSRLILASQIKIFSSERYKALTQLALEIYTSWVKGQKLDGNSLPHKPTDTYQVLLVVESIYHLLELLLLENRPRDEALDTLKKKLSAHLEELDSTFGHKNLGGVVAQLQDALRRDRELNAKLAQAVGEDEQEELFQILDDFVSS